MSAGRVEDGAEIPHYTWGGTEEAGYHINGSSSSSILERRIFPSLNTLRKLSIVADFGCGDGRIQRRAPHWSQRPYIYIGIDRDPTAVAKYNSYIGYTSDRAIVADLTELGGGESRYDAAFCWRVPHTIPREFQEQVFKRIAETLKPGAVLHVSARSDQCWVASFLKDRGLYRPGEMNDYYPAMKEVLDPLGITTWPSSFFRNGELAALCEQAGLRVEHQEQIHEPSGFAILREQGLLTYDYVEAVKR